MFFCTLLRRTALTTERLSCGTIRTQLRTPTTSNVLLPRGYATGKPAPPLKKPPPPPLSKALGAARSSRRVPPPSVTSSEFIAQRRNGIIEKLFNSGDRTLFRSTGRTTRFRVTAWTLTLLAALGITNFWLSGFFDVGTFRETQHDNPGLVYGAFIIASLFLGAVAGWTLKKSWNHIDSIDLIQKSGNIMMQVTVRSGVPYMKKRMIVKPQHILVDPRVIEVTRMPQMFIPQAPSERSPSAFTAGVLRETVRSFSRFFYQVFDAARFFFSEEGFIKLDIKEERKGKLRTESYYLDNGGEFLFDNKDERVVFLWDLVDMKQPYGRR